MKKKKQGKDGEKVEGCKKIKRGIRRHGLCATLMESFPITVK
jgi:hypothetical protein